MGEVEIILNLVTSNGSWSRGREKLILQQEYWTWIKVHTIEVNISRNFKRKIMINDLSNFCE